MDRKEKEKLRKIKEEEDLLQECDEILKRIAEERADSLDGKTDIERELSYISVRDLFKPFTI